MEKNYWNKLHQINNYLLSKKGDGVKAFEVLIQQAITDEAELVVITFTYEHIEAYGKVDGQFKMLAQLFSILNRYEIEDLTSDDYDEEDRFQDFRYSTLGDLASQLIDLWVAACFKEAVTSSPTDIPFYFKQSHDGMNILDLHDCKVKFEKAEFETYVRNNQRNLMRLLGA